jgi:Ca2+-transporting ATPase
LGALNNYDKEKQFRELKAKNDKTRTVTIIRKGESLIISEEEILVGDKLLIEGGMTMCADGILVKGNNILMDESAMTGEIDMIEKEIYEDCIRQRQTLLKDHPELRKSVPENYHHKLKSPLISSGTQVSTGKGYIIVTAVGINSQNGKIMSLIKANKENDEGTPLQQKLVYMADFIGWCGFVAAIFTAIGMSINLIIRASQGLAGQIGIEIMNILLISVRYNNFR